MKQERIYHILIDRFFPIRDEDTNGNFKGGCIKSIIEHLDYIQGLGMSGIMLTPFYKTAAYHGYHIVDFEQVDSHFGTKADMKELVKICDHIVFNSFRQYEKYKELCKQSAQIREDGKPVSVGIRVNPECSTQEGHEIYDPCGPGSRLGVTKAEFREDLLEGVEGLHFHTLCEQDADDLVITFRAFEEKFGKYLKKMKWLNLGGGHHITRPGYQLKQLKQLIAYIRATYQVEVYLEPGEAIALNAGYLVTEVQDIVKNGMEILILDASAACHMPDVLEMPYRPPLRGGYEPGEKTYTYRLSSMTCLAGDVIGDYSFEHPVAIGDRLVFEDMAIYSMVKNNTFNGMPLPGIALLKEDGTVEMIKTFGYEDFKERLS